MPPTGSAASRLLHRSDKARHPSTNQRVASRFWRLSLAPAEDLERDPDAHGAPARDDRERRAEPHQAGAIDRSEERRVGKECRSRWWAQSSKKIAVGSVMSAIG